MNSYCVAALDYLPHCYDADAARFSYLTKIGEHCEIANDFVTEGWLRYTINTYLGLSEAERHGGVIPWLGDVQGSVEKFLALHEAEITNSGDLGLLLVLLRAASPNHPAVARSIARLAAVIADETTSRGLNMQDLAWMLWGACNWYGDPSARVLATRCFGVIRDQFVDQRTGLPRHSIKAYRRHAVSFGSIVYFLRAMYEYGEASGSIEAGELFARCLSRVLALQAEDGAWPWLIDVRSGVPIDLYPVFSVHQDSMAMLFLFPAQMLGIGPLDAVIERSFNWNYGFNELAVPLVGSRGGSAWFDRSIERDERWTRARRYMRGLGPAKREFPARTSSIRLNQECRSYHLGWVLYAWSGRGLPSTLEPPPLIFTTPSLFTGSDEQDLGLRTA